MARAAVLTVSDGVSQGTREDASGDLAEELLADGYAVRLASVSATTPLASRHEAPS